MFEFCIFVFICIVLFWIIYKSIYYKSSRFNSLKTQMIQYIDECNKLNRHIEELKNIRLDNNITYSNEIHLSLNDGNYTYKRRHLRNYSNRRNVYNCSLSVFRNAREQPFKYLCKYFNIAKNEETLNKFEDAFNNFSAVEQGKQLLLEYKQQFLMEYKSQIPSLILR